MKQFAYDKVLIVLIIIGLCASLFINIQRHEVEVRNNSIELIVDYEDLLELAQREGVPVSEVMRQAKDAGITSLAVYETTFKKLNVNGKTVAVNGSDVLANYQNGAMTDPEWRKLVENGTIKGTEIYVTGHDKQTFREVHEDLIRRLGNDRVTALNVGGETVLAVKAHFESFEKMDLGMPTDEMKAVNDGGFYVLARPTNYRSCTKDDVDAFFSRIDGFDVSGIVFSGSQTLGAPDYSEYTAQRMEDRGLTLGMIEGVTQLRFFPQDGMLDIAKANDYRSARLYSIPKDEQKKMKIGECVDRWANTDAERNIRFNLLKIFDKPAPGMNLLETNMTYFASTRDALVKQGFTIGKAGVFEGFYPASWLRALVMAGVAAGCVLYLSLVIPGLNKKYLYGLLLVGLAVCVIPVLMGHGNKIRLVAALASANVFPAIAVIWQLDRIRLKTPDESASLPKIILTGIVALFTCGIMSYVGASYLSGSLADTEYLLEVNIFRGIKLTFILPIILVAIAFMQRFDLFDGKMDDTEGFMDQFRKIMDMPVKVKTLIGLFLVLVAGIVFVARSGHTMGMPVSSAELKFRAFLEQAMYARPRSKELLIGHPAFMLAMLAWFRKWPTMILFVLVLIATIGQGSMVETFAHMRSPVFMSFARGIGGIVLGAGIGAVCMVLVQLWSRYVSPRLLPNKVKG
ncbi:MAG: DUF5693 family protein [Anaerovibrio sp.]|uniref:DUF5693 family protein n=1 Tax=Anaerovibrio sp. TaxID=1872532 RepID=UPI0025DB8CBD|nr:DUF5693 family protein [Anaerovibrio sp.]MCR5176228.1 DUF5693 family protein [Anaerovibrio sp.]